jgi:tetratricopeptide (TPR) repeat protein
MTDLSAFGIRHLAFSILSAAILAGCGPTKDEINARVGVDSYLSGNFAGAVRNLGPLADKENENYVLNNLRLGASALATYDFDTAETAYVKAYDILNATNVNDAGREARATWLLESNKVWRGEPYERAIANLQLGMIYYQAHDYGNARGAFENALFKLRDYADPKKPAKYDEHESDFAVALLMLGRTWANLHNPSESRRYFDLAVQYRPELKPLADALADANNNVLLYVEFGFGPRKTEEGMDGNALGFFPKPGQVGPPPPMQVTVDGGPREVSTLDKPLFDSIVMAQDRRWQKLDTIRKTKSYLGTGLMVAGAGATIYGADRRDGGTAAVGLGLLAAGALLKASSAADIRSWEMVPRCVYVIPMHVDPGKHDIGVAFPGGLNQTWRGLDVPATGEVTFYYRMLRWTSGVHTWPPGSDAAMPDSLPRPRTRGRGPG